MRKITAISLLSIVTISLFGYYCFYAFEIYTAKKTAKKEILKQAPDHLLIKISADAIVNWEEEGEEFRLKDGMYDVVRVVFEEGKKYFLCISDTKEEALIKALSKLINANPDSRPGGKHNANLKLPAVDVFCNNPDNPSEAGIKKYTSFSFYNYESRLCLTDKKITTPPPQPFI